MPSLADLYQALDWSGADAALARWEHLHQTDPDTRNDGFRYRWRCVLLEQALYSTDEDAMRQARGLLSLAGVWPQVVAFLQAKSII